MLTNKQHIMKKSLFYICLVTLCTLTSCSNNLNDLIVIEDPNSVNTKNKILPLGASRVEGARPIFESYRYELWKKLIDGGYDFDFLGSNLDESSYSNYSNQSFDRDHSGYSGFTSGQILNNLNSWLQSAGTPDIVLLSSPGGNDALLNLSYDTAVANINSIIDILQDRNPNVTIIIEQLAPGKTEIMTQTLTNYMMQMQQEVISIASNQTTSTSRILVVDMFTGFNDNLLADDVHYNDSGARFIADRYYMILQSILE